jgi:hypothetical protein
MSARLLSLCLAILLLGASAQASSTMGYVVTVIGDAWVIREAAQATGKQMLKAAAEVFAGDVVGTGANGRTQLLLGNKSVVNVGPASQINLAALRPNDSQRKVGFKLMVGRIWARVSHLMSDEPQFTVETSNAVAGVRGTSFFMEAAEDGSSTATTVLAGSVQVDGEQGQSVLVGPMQRALAQLGRDLVVTPATADDLSALMQQLAAPPTMDGPQLNQFLQQVQQRLGALQTSPTPGTGSPGTGTGGQPNGGGSGGPSLDDQMRSLLLGSPDAGQPSPQLNVEPGSDSTVVHGRVEPVTGP